MPASRRRAPAPAASVVGAAPFNWRRAERRAPAPPAQSRPAPAGPAQRQGAAGVISAPARAPEAQACVLRLHAVAERAARLLCAQIGRVLGPGLALYFKALRTLALVFAGLVTTCAPRRAAPQNAPPS